MKSSPHAIFTILTAAGFGLMLAACEVGPDYQKPDTTVPENWAAAPGNADVKAEIDQKWWKNFNDPVLTSLIEKAAANNLDLKVAEARIAEARAGAASAGAALLPTGDLKGTATREANRMALPGGNGNGLGNLLHKPFNVYETGFDASWELDLFGGNRRAEEAAEAEMQASEATRDDVLVSMLAEVARTYVDIRRANAKLAVAEDIVAADQKTLDIARQRFNVGQAPRLDVVNAEAQLQSAETQMPDIRNQAAQAEYQMDVLLGEQPGAAHRMVGAPSPIPASDKKLVLAAPASVIAQRPDIRVAERKLAAATAQQGVAVAKFFPDISLTGFFGALNTSTQNLVTAANQSWMAGGSILWPILSYGTLSANLDKADAQQQEAMATYQKSILSALSDVERSLNAYTEQEKFLLAAANQVEQDKHATSIARQRYKEGLTSFQEVLDAERTLYTAQNSLAEARANETQDLIAVYKSLGGGWV